MTTIIIVDGYLFGWLVFCFLHLEFGTFILALFYLIHILSSLAPTAYFINMSGNHNMFRNRLSDNKMRLKLAQEMPFFTCTDYQLYRECSTQIGNIFEIFNDNIFARQIKTLVNNFTTENYNCKYYNTSQFQSLIKNFDTDDLKMIHFNIRSFEKNKFYCILF